MSSITLLASTQNSCHNQPRDFAEEWNQRLTLSNSDFINRYINLQMWMFVHFRIGNSQEYVACLQCLDRGSNVDHLSSPFRDGESFSGMYPGPVFSLFFGFDSGLTSRIVGGGCCEEQTVFVSIVKLSEFPEKIVPSLVWFDSVEKVFERLPKALYFSSLHGGLVLRGGFEDWEIYPHAGGNYSAVQVVSSVIEGAAKIPNSITDHQGDFVFDRGELAQAKNEFSRIRIMLTFDSVWVGFDDGIASSIEVIDVLVGPYHLCRKFL